LTSLAAFGVKTGIAGVLPFLSVDGGETVSGDVIEIPSCLDASVVIFFSSQLEHNDDLRKCSFFFTFFHSLENELSVLMDHSRLHVYIHK
jgi:hypothetical protein